MAVKAKIGKCQVAALWSKFKLSFRHSKKAESSLNIILTMFYLIFSIYFCCVFKSNLFSQVEYCTLGLTTFLINLYNTILYINTVKSCGSVLLNQTEQRIIQRLGLHLYPLGLQLLVASRFD